MANFAESTFLRGNDGGVAAVEDHRLIVTPRSEFQQAVADGMAFAWASITKDIDVNDTVIALENNSTEHVLVIEKIILSVDTGGFGSVLPVFAASGVTLSGDAITAVNLNRGSGIVASSLATCVGDDTGNTEAASSWPKRLYMAQAYNSYAVTINVNGAVQLPCDHMIGVDTLTEPTACNATIFGWFKAI